MHVRIHKSPRIPNPPSNLDIKTKISRLWSIPDHQQAPGSDAARSESLVKETDFYDTSVDGMRSGSQNRQYHGVNSTRQQAWFRALSVITLVRCACAHHPV
jgi:hypothetical protein